MFTPGINVLYYNIIIFFTSYFSILNFTKISNEHIEAALFISVCNVYNVCSFYSVDVVCIVYAICAVCM